MGSSGVIMSRSTGNIGFLINRGKELSDLLKKIETRSVELDILPEVTRIINSILAEIKEIVGFHEDSMKKLLKKIQSILEEIIKWDVENKISYEDLIKMVAGRVEFKTRATVLTSDETSKHSDESAGDHDSLNEAELNSAFQKLSFEDQQRLSCLLLFPKNAVISKREIIHCWIGMGLIDTEPGDSLLEDLVKTGLIKGKIVSNKRLNKYKMPGKFHSLLKEKTKMSAPTGNNAPTENNSPTENNARTEKKGTWSSWSILYNNEQQKKAKIIAQSENKGSWTSWNILHNNEQQSGDNPTLSMTGLTASPISRDINFGAEALLNIKQSNLDAERFRSMSQMNKLKVVHLGSWQTGSTRYIVVKDVDAFRYLKRLSKVAYLSLQEVSGIVKLPSSVYELRLLKVLNLRGCNNLEELSPGIKSLTCLTHLDLTGCYLLDHVPVEITTLTTLLVLKGFIINTDTHMNTSHVCQFSDLSKLINLRKLTILTRKMDFPTEEDFETFSKMEKLTILRIAWVTTLASSTNKVTIHGNDSGFFLASLTKLELQAAPGHKASHLLSLISNSTKNCALKNFYIRGGGLTELKGTFVQPRVVRLRYLPQLDIDWDDFQNVFPNLDRLEILGCKKLIDKFPCDKDGVWERVPEQVTAL